MATLPRLRISLKPEHAIEVPRVSVGARRLVYVICASRPLPYEKGASKIAYIGTTQNGIDRVAQSAASRSDEVLGLHGIDRFHVRVVTCGPRRHVRSWRRLERAFLIRFRERYGEVPYCNATGAGMVEKREFELFARSRIDAILEDLNT